MEKKNRNELNYKEKIIKDTLKLNFPLQLEQKGTKKILNKMLFIWIIIHGNYIRSNSKKKKINIRNTL